MIALCRQPSVFIGNDSGPMHRSAAAGNKVLAIFGPTSPLRFGPWPIGSPRTRALQAPGGSSRGADRGDGTGNAVRAVRDGVSRGWDDSFRIWRF